MKLYTLRALEREATPGKWYVRPDTSYYPVRHTVNVVDGSHPIATRVIRLKDARLIADARNALPALLEEIDRIAAELKRITRERNIAVKVLSESDNPCLHCHFAIDGESVCCEDCDDCDEDTCDESCKWFGDICGTCEHGGKFTGMVDNWQWRGAKEDRHDESDL